MKPFQKLYLELWLQVALYLGRLYAKRSVKQFFLGGVFQMYLVALLFYTGTGLQPFTWALAQLYNHSMYLQQVAHSMYLQQVALPQTMFKIQIFSTLIFCETHHKKRSKMLISNWLS
jgi:hypothetical protein